MGSLPTAYLNEIEVLNREISESQPADVLQYCANFFSRRLEQERSQLLANSEHQPRSPSQPMSAASPFSGGVMGDGIFSPSYRPSQSAAYDGSSDYPPNRPRDSITGEEEDSVHELRPSPTAPSFRVTSAPGESAGGPFSNSSPFGNPSPFSNQSPFGNPSPFGNTSPFSPSQFGSLDPMGPPSNSGAAQSGPPRRSPSPGAVGSDFPNNFSRVRRVSVSAESLAPSTSNDEFTPPVYPKTTEQLNRLKTAIGRNFLFTSLDEEQSSQVLGALNEKPIPASGTRVITQGDVGDFFYVIERGDFDVFVNPSGTMQSGPGGMGNKVAVMKAGDSFGELALMYNAPRAATIISTTPHSILWSLDRVTFRRILMENTSKRRKMYEAFLEEVPLFTSLLAYERSKIADALDTKTFEQGDVIIRRGDIGDNFYLLESGTAEAYLNGGPEVDVNDKPVMSYKKGDYFGELALLNDEPRAASVIASSKVKVAYLGKEGFQRLLGPVAEIMRRNDPRLKETQDVPTQADGVDPFDERV